MDLEPLRRRIDGTVSGRDDADYEGVRATTQWNERKPGRRPELIVRVAGRRDVVEAVRFARSHGLQIAVRSGGHHMCGPSLRDGSMLVDLSRLRAIAVDVPSRRVTVQPAVCGRDLSARLAIDGLAFPVGHCSSVGLGGYLLSGGFGWNSGAWGPACSSVSAIEVVTADGEMRTADDQHDADLLWAARGAGPGFFGVVTRFRLQVHPLPGAIATSTFVFPLEHATRAARWATEAATELAPSVEQMLRLVSLPVSDSSPAIRQWVCVVVATAFAETKQEAEDALRPLLRRYPAEVCLSSTLHQPTPFPALFDGMNALFPERHRYLSEALWSDVEPAELVDAARRHVVAAPSPRSLVLCPILGPPRADAPSLPDAAFSMTARSTMLCYAVWNDPEGDDANQSWHRGLVDALEPHAVGWNVAESDIMTSPSRAERSFSPASWRRLQALRQKYDPEGVLCGFFGSS